MSVLIPLLIAAMVAMAIAKAAADAKKGIDESNANAGNAGLPSATNGLPQLQQPETGPQSQMGTTNQNAFAPAMGPHGQWNLNPFTVSGGAGADMPSLGMGGPDLGPMGTDLPPLQQGMSSVSGPQNHLSISGGQGLANPFATGAPMGAPAATTPMIQPMPSTPPPAMTPAPPPPPMPQSPPIQAEPPSVGNGMQIHWPWG